MTYNTHARVRILEFLRLNSDKAFCAGEILSAISEDKLVKSTLFRQLSSLCEAGKIKRIANEKHREVKYQYIDFESCHEHLHLKCKSCGRLLHLDSELSQLLEQKLLSGCKFTLDKSAWLTGKCDKCI